MLVNIGQLRERSEPLALELDFTEEALKIKSDLGELERPAHADLRLSLSGDLVRVRGRISAVLRLMCCRCLKPIQESVDKEFEVEYSPDPLVDNEGDEFELNYDDLLVGFYRNDQLDLSALVGEQIVLETPMHPICRESCQGLCDQCGADLNEGQCACVRETIDPRLAPLAALKQRLQ